VAAPGARLARSDLETLGVESADLARVPRSVFTFDALRVARRGT
jgi:hypothetical protein